jgi:hypothetical protein
MTCRSAATNKGKPPASRVAVTVRIPKAVIESIDLDLDRRAVPLSRNSWLLEAVVEKLRRTAAGGTDGAT